MLKAALEPPVIPTQFKVRMEPYLVESICELSRLMRDKGNVRGDIGGLLFGKADQGTRTVEALKTFVDAGPHSELARRERLEKAYTAALEEAKTDPELSSFEVVGWFSFRNGSGLLSSDVTFHNQHFRKPEDLALVVWREGPSQITAEVYSKSNSESLSEDDYRWGSVRLSADIRHMREPVELSMRAKLTDDSYLNAYDSDEPPSQFESLMRKAEAASDKLFGFLYKRKEEEQAGNVRALIGDGRLPSRASWPPEAREQAPTPQTYFNPYATAKQQTPTAAGDSPLLKAWPGIAGGATAPAPARAADPRLDFRLTDHRSTLRPPLALPPGPGSDFNPGFDFGRIGQAPRSGRSAQPEISGLPMLLQAPKKPFSFSIAWPLAAMLFLLCSGAVFAFFSLGGLQGDGGRIGQAFHAMFPGGELNLRVRSEDDRLRLTWNQRNHAVAAATDGVLQIFDGQQHREVHLDGRQVADGSVLYRPVTNDVSFRLEVRGEQGGVSGSVRVLDGLSSQQPVLDVSAPATIGSAPRDQHLLANSNSGVQDPNSPTLLRPDSAADASVVAPPVTETPYVAPSQTVARSTYQPKPQARYETPQNIGTITGAGGTTINGWDAAALKSRSKRYPQRVLPRPTAAATSGFVAPRPLMQVMPRTNTIPTGTIQARTRVEVEVHVDPIGKVAAARVVGAGINESIASAALAAARQWTFEPASDNGQHVESDHMIVFEFRPER